MGNNLNFNYYLGYLGETPVASSILFKGNETAGIYYVGTLHEARNRGIAKAMTNNLLKNAKTEGYKISVLHASERGCPLYKNIGFKKYYNMNIYKKSNF
jgi:predicted acetyltransferase